MTATTAASSTWTSKEAYDRGDKFVHYQLLESFVEYLLVSQYFYRVEKFARQDDHTWIYSKYETPEQIVKIETIECELPISEIYRKVYFNPHRRRHNHLSTPA